MKKIPLTQGFETIVDDEDFDFLMQWSWCYHKGYAVNTKTGRHLYMHRMVNKTPQGFQTDHVNLDRLDNRRSNLRTVTRAENNINRVVKANSTSKYKGVSWQKRHKNWIAQIKPIGSPRIYLGTFKDELDAATAYNLGVALFGNANTRLNIGG